MSILVSKRDDAYVFRLRKPVSESNGGTVSAIYRYPVKGLSPEPLERVDLKHDETLPGDRVYAVENGAGRFNADEPKYLPKINFLMLMRNERLAKLDTKFDPDSHELKIFRSGKQVVSGDLSTKLGRTMVEQFMAGFVRKERLRGAPHIVHAPGHSFSDVSAKCVHLVNMASVREVERVSGRTVDPLRFRANIYLDGLPPWQEFDWLDKEIAIDRCRLAVFQRTARCAATDVNPQTGERDMALPSLLERHWGHRDFGVYARVIEGGVVASGSVVQAP